MPTIKELKEQRAQALSEVRALEEKYSGAALPDEAKPAWERFAAECETLEAQITAAENELKDRAARYSKINEFKGGNAFERPGGNGNGEQFNAKQIETDQKKALRAFFMGDNAPDNFVEAAERVGFGRSLRRNEMTLNIGDDQFSNLNPLEGQQGGFLVAPTLWPRIQVAMKAYNAMEQVAEIFTTAGGEEITMPTVDDTGTTAAILPNETDASYSNFSVAGKVLRAYEYSSNGINVKNTLLQDTGFDLEGLISRLLGERVGRKAGSDMTIGTGNNQPYGIVPLAPTGKTTASATAITFDELKDLQGALDPAYSGNPTVGWMMHNNIRTAIAKLKDSQNRYLWEPSTQVGNPDMLLGRPVYLNQFMDSAVTTGKKTVIYGDLNYYKIRRVASVTFRRLNELRALRNESVFVMFVRMDGNLLNASSTSSLSPVQLLVQA